MAVQPWWIKSAGEGDGWRHGVWKVDLSSGVKNSECNRFCRPSSFVSHLLQQRTRAMLGAGHRVMSQSDWKEVDFCLQQRCFTVVCKYIPIGLPPLSFSSSLHSQLVVSTSPCSASVLRLPESFSYPSGLLSPLRLAHFMFHVFGVFCASQTKNQVHFSSLDAVSLIQRRFQPTGLPLVTWKERIFPSFYLFCHSLPVETFFESNVACMRRSLFERFRQLLNLTLALLSWKVYHLLPATNPHLSTLLCVSCVG